MGMKLLPKSEIDRQKAVEQRTAVDEGAKIARRVDRLREVSAETEATLKALRDKTVAQIHEEIAQKLKEKGEIIAEVKALEERRIELQKPLDSEWAKVREAAADVNRRTEDANVIEHKLADREGEIALKEKKVASTLIRVTTKEDLATSNLKDAAYANSAAQQAQASATSIKEEVIRIKTKTEAELIHREELVAGRESNATIKEQDLVAREKVLADGWRLLEDRQALFERSIKRVKKEPSNVN